MYASFEYGVDKVFTVGVFIEGTVISGFIQPGVGMSNLIPIQMIDVIKDVDEIAAKN
jgi:hypothetical protein